MSVMRAICLWEMRSGHALTEAFGPEKTLSATVRLKHHLINHSINFSFISVAIDCGYLDDITNGVVDLDGTTFGSTASYTCASGFVLMGKGIRQCQGNGFWSGEAPVCEGLRASVYYTEV